MKSIRPTPPDSAAANRSLGVQLPKRGSDFDRLSHGMCSRHETRHMPRLPLAPLRAHPRSRAAVAELLVVRPFYAFPSNRG